MRWIDIARLTWLELWQNRTYKTLLVMAALTPLGGITLGALFMADIGKVYMDAVAAVSQLLAVVFLLFLAVKLLSRDIFDRVCYILLTTPVTRTDYYSGRFIGLVLVFMVLLIDLMLSAVLGAFFYIEGKAEIYQSGYSWLLVAEMMFFHFFQYVSLLGIIFFIVSWSSGDAETMLFTVSVLIFTWVFPPVLKAMQNPDVSSEVPDMILNMLQVVYEMIPHLQGGEISLRLAHGSHIGLSDALLYALEHTLYGIVFFVIGLIIFKRRDL